MTKIYSVDFTKEHTLDYTIWNIAVGEKWANNELQQYTDDKENLFFNDQGLVIKATYKDGIYRSARIHTKDKLTFKYGRVDIVASVPSGKGTWPALWMMPNDSVYGGWPRSGEIDIMEHVGNKKDMLYMCIHTEGYNHRRKEQYFHTTTLPNIADHFHKYSLEWTADTITYFVDDVKMHTYTKGEEGKDASHVGWPFDQPFYLIMNLAVGGSLGGDVDPADFPQSFTIKSIDIDAETE